VASIDDAGALSPRVVNADILRQTARRSTHLPLDTAFSVCPHDCPSACALEVERIDGRIGRIRGARAQGYTDGVVCAKVGRYAERQYHPDRLSVPLRRVGDKGVGHAAFVPVSWDDALDLVAEGLTRAASVRQRSGLARITIRARWGWCSATGCSVCACDALLAPAFDDLQRADRCRLAGRGRRQARRRRARDGEIGPDRRLGGNPVSTQVNVMTHIAKARKERGAKLVVVDP